MPIRHLYPGEIALARPVFKDSLPWQRIQVSSDIGVGGRPYTMGRTIKAGSEYYKGMHWVTGGSKVLVHELTHVWQSEHRGHRAAYIIDAVGAQMMYGQSAYAYKPGLDWDEYNAEQQASIVEDWYGHGQTTSDPLYGYVRDQIQQKHIAPDDSIWDNAF